MYSRSIYFFVQDPKPLEVYSADFVIDGPQLGFLGNVPSFSFSFSFFQFFFRLYTYKIISKDMSQIKLIRGQLFNHLHSAIFPLQVSFIKDFHFNSWPRGLIEKYLVLFKGASWKVMTWTKGIESQPELIDESFFFFFFANFDYFNL